LQLTARARPGQSKWSTALPPDAALQEGVERSGRLAP
jgi:hypothetical protein